jgi:cytochrome c oxidase cbb3-type subunit IV
MDVNDLRSGVTVLSMLVFLGIAAWAWSRCNQSRFDEAARLPFEPDGSGEGDAR